MDSEVSDEQILELWRKYANQVVAKLNGVKKLGPVAVAIEMIASRIVASGNSLAVLHNHSPHAWAFDGASVLRNIYDVMLQGLYIMVDAAYRIERAQLYLDFMDVERMRRIKLMDASGTDIAKHVSGSPKRPEAEPAIKQRHDAIKARFETKNKKLRDRWYPGNLRDLAKASSLEQEYELMQKFLSGVVHSSPLTLKEGPIVRGFLLMDWHWKFTFRILGAYAEFKGVGLDETEMNLIVSARANVFNAS